MNYDRMAQEYLEEVGRLNRRLDQLRKEASSGGNRIFGSGWASLWRSGMTCV